MALPPDSEKANLKLLKALTAQTTDQQSLLATWQSANKHQLAICFMFPPGFSLNLNGGTKQSTHYAERVLRLCESVNQPDTIKADLWTLTENGGTVSGVMPGAVAQGTPIPPEEFLDKLGYVIVAFVSPGSKTTPKSGSVNKIKGLLETLDVSKPLAGEADPELEKLLAEEEAIDKAYQPIDGLKTIISETPMSYEEWNNSQMTVIASGDYGELKPKVKPYDPNDDAEQFHDDE